MQAFRILIIFCLVITLFAVGSSECWASHVQSRTSTRSSDSPVCFIRHEIYSETIFELSCVQPVDLDGDTDIDIVMTASGSGLILWFENNGMFEFTDHMVGEYHYHPEELSIADLDDDGDLDIASTASGIYPEDPGRVSWWENDGSQNFSEHDIDTERTGAKTVRTTDLDDDGDMDIIIGCRKNNNLFWYENDGSGNFTKYLLGYKPISYSVEPIDLDKDGDLDVLANSPGGYVPWVSWFENDGDQVFTEHVIDATYENAADVCASDLDDDGDLDVICAAANFGNDKGDRIAWWENDGNQQFEKHILVENYFCTKAVESADLDRDGRTDIIASQAVYNGDKSIIWLRNEEDRVFELFIIEDNFNPLTSLKISDMDQDGDMDVVAGEAWGRVAWWENQPNVTVQPSMPSHFYYPGDTFSLDVVLDNPSPDQTLEQMPLFVLLYYGGTFFFHPEWSQEVGYTLVDIPPGVSTVSLIDPFPWPDGAGEASGVYFFATLATQDLSQMFGVYGYWEFGWSERGVRSVLDS